MENAYNTVTHQADNVIVHLETGDAIKIIYQYLIVTITSDS